MDRIGIRELRQDLSSQVKRAAAGETIVVTVDGQPKARLTPLAGTRAEVTAESLIASGRLMPAKRRRGKPSDTPPRIRGKRPSQEVLDEFRADRF